MSSISSEIPLERLQDSETAFESLPSDPSSLPVPNPTRSFWIDTPDANPLAGQGSQGPLTQEADICIIGSGITGVSAAHHIAEAVQRRAVPSQSGNNPLRVVILEARDFWSGATGRNGGHLTPLVFFDFCGYQARYGTEQAVRALALEDHTASEIVKLIREEGWADSVDLVEGGHATAFLTESEYTAAKADFDAAKEAGVDLTGVRWVSTAEMQSKYGTLHPGVEIGGHNLWPLKFVTHLYRLAKSLTPDLELSLHTRTPVGKITPSSDSRRWALETPRGILRTNYIIHATNAYASHLLPQLAGPGGIVATRGQVCAVRAPGLKWNCSWDANQGFEYWFPRPQQDSDAPPLIILGGGREVGPGFEYNQTDDSVVDEPVGGVLRRFLPAVFPEQFEDGVEPEMEWTGIMAYTKSRDPFVGPVIGETGQYISAGYSGHGMPRAFSCAAVVAGMALADMTGKEWKAPEWFPEAFLTTRK
ncbi:FAD dependent oxidoreductase [Roridomyces roridus]|uniref:FAD dependent oxidoreductase n=1 Tax=Roridomyces roridus TaxID=1738132 RepID=A0AAD7BNH5_9AGAR|nr:FAD dependent oxidoreductase [Roridomyces roridus]